MAVIVRCRLSPPQQGARVLVAIAGGAHCALLPSQERDGFGGLAVARGRGRSRVDWNVGTPGSIQEITYTVPADKCGLVIGKGRSGCGGLSTLVSQREPRSCSPVPILAPSTSVTWVSFALPVSLALVRGCPATAREAGLCPLGMCGARVEDVGESPGLSGPCNPFVPCR